MIRFLVLIIFLTTCPSCSRHSNGTESVVRPKTYHRWYKPGKDKHKKRTKVVKMKG